MFFYQALIMVVVVTSIYLLSIFLKGKKRKFLVVSIIVLVTIGGVCLYAVQYCFSNHFYDQKVNLAALDSIDFTTQQKADLHRLFSDYNQVSFSGRVSDEIAKTYHINSNGVYSVIESDIYLFSNTKDADNYFNASQKFYENKSYIPLDSDKTKKADVNNRYLISFIKSQYKDYTDIIYLPSKITYASDVVLQDENVIIQITETSNKPATNKNTVINDIITKLKQ